MLAPREAARRLGVAERTLAAWRQRGTGPVWVRVGARTIRYRGGEVAAWLGARQAPTPARTPLPWLVRRAADYLAAADHDAEMARAALDEAIALAGDKSR
jgi:predicted DNA-binding transcriptional regulator AlpA